MIIFLIFFNHFLTISLQTQDLDAVKLKLFKIEEEKYHYEDTSKVMSL